MVGCRYHQSYLFKLNLRFVALILWLSRGGIGRKGKTNLADKSSDSYLYGRPTDRAQHTCHLSRIATSAHCKTLPENAVLYTIQGHEYIEVRGNLGIISSFFFSWPFISSWLLEARVG